MHNRAVAWWSWWVLRKQYTSSYDQVVSCSSFVMEPISVIGNDSSLQYSAAYALFLSIVLHVSLEKKGVRDCWTFDLWMFKSIQRIIIQSSGLCLSLQLKMELYQARMLCLRICSLWVRSFDNVAVWITRCFSLLGWARM